MKPSLIFFLCTVLAFNLAAAPAGFPDPTFGTKGRVFTDFTDFDSATCMAVQADNKIIVAGNVSTPENEIVRIALARYKPNGELDSTFGQGGKVITPASFTQEAAYAITLQADGKVLVAASVQMDDGFHLAILRYLANGTLDSSFGNGGRVPQKIGSYYDTPCDISVQSDGKILVAGATTSVHGKGLLIRLNTDGTLDLSFGQGGVVTTNITDNSDAGWLRMIPMADGKILASGSAQNGTLMARFQADGTLDPSFGVAGKLVLTSVSCSSMEVQSDTKVLLSVSMHSGVGLVRLNADGSFDTSFSDDGIATIVLPGINPILSDLVIQADGKYVITGQITDSSGPNWHANLILARCLPDGSLDPTFGVDGVCVVDNKGDDDFYGVVGLLNEGSILVASTRLYDRSRPPNPSWGALSDFALYRFTGTQNDRLAFSEDPHSELLLSHESTSLVSAVQGGNPITQVWQKNGAAISGATGATFAIPAASFRDVGAYSVRAKNALDTVISETAFIAVIQTAPDNLVVADRARVTLRCDLSAPAGTTFSYHWFFNNSPLNPTPGMSGEETKTLTIAKMGSEFAGVYDCWVLMDAPDRSVLRYRGKTSLELPVQPGLTTFAMDDARVGQDISFTIPRDGNPNQFTITGLPAGLTYNAVTGVISGRATRPGSYTLRITAANQAGNSNAISIPWTVAPYGGAGQYVSLIERKAEFDGGKGLGGLIRFTVTSTATVSGQLVLGGITRNFAGPASAQPDDSPALFQVRVPGQATQPPINLSLTIATFGDGDGQVIDDDGVAVAIILHKQRFGPAVPATRFAGAYTWLMDSLQVPANPGVPEGSGFMAATVLRSGVINWTGRLADNTSLTGSSFLTGPDEPTEQHPVFMHHGLDGGLGSIHGYVSIFDDLDGPGLLPLVGGELDWLKLPFVPKPRYKVTRGGAFVFLPPTLGDRAYPSGIALYTLNVNGGKYVKPGPGERLLGYSKVTSPDRNGELMLSGGGLTANITRLVTLAAGHQVIMEPAAPSDPQISLSLSSTTGAVAGTLTLNDPPLKRSVPFSGVLVPHLGTGGGFFLLPQLPGSLSETLATTPVLSGKVLLRGAK